jgi:hypothetical protein
MKRIVMLVLLIGSFVVANAQYSKEKITEILTGGNSKSWTVKSQGHPEKTFVFNKNMSAQMNGANTKWSISSQDNIRWFTTVGSDSYETIVSYDKAGKQFVKLTRKGDGKPGSNYELILYPSE